MHFLSHGMVVPCLVCLFRGVPFRAGVRDVNTVMRCVQLCVFNGGRMGVNHTVM